MLTYALGFQADPKNFNTDCIKSVFLFTEKTKALQNSFKTFTIKDWLKPFYLFQEDTVQLTTVFSNCQTTNAAKQLARRTAELGGFMNLIGTFVGAYVKQKVGAGTSTTYNAMQKVADPKSCAEFGESLGILMSNALAFQTPEQTFYSQMNVGIGVDMWQ